MSNDHIDTYLPHVPATGHPANSGLPPLLAQLAQCDAVSGPELARRLGISRAAVWKQVAGLRKAGLCKRAVIAAYNERLAGGS